MITLAKIEGKRMNYILNLLFVSFLKIYSYNERSQATNT